MRVVISLLLACLYVPMMQSLSLSLGFSFFAPLTYVSVACHHPSLGSFFRSIGATQRESPTIRHIAVAHHSIDNNTDSNSGTGTISIESAHITK